MDRSLNQITYDRFKKDIMTFALKPGEPVSASKIAERYGVSRTPAREALVRLQDEGMIDIFPQSKSMISKINEERIWQEWFVRKSLEIGMVEAFFKGVRAEDIVKMKECVERIKNLTLKPVSHETSFEYIRCDDEFHYLFHIAAGEKLAADIIRNSLPNYKRVRLLIDMENTNKDRTISDHETLIRLTEEGKVKEYGEFLEEHLSHIVKDIPAMREKYPSMFEN